MVDRPTPRVARSDASLAPDARALLAWRVELAEAERNPWLASVLLRELSALLARAAQAGARLAALPRRARRGLARRSALSLPLAALALAVTGGPAFADTIELGVGGCGTIRDAINAANSGGTVNGCTGSGAANTIVLGGGTYTYTDSPPAYDADGDNALPSITSDLTIEGGGAVIERDTAVGDTFRLFHVAASGDVTLREATVRGGVADVGGTALTGLGGGLMNLGVLELDRVTVSGSSATHLGGGIFVGAGTSVTLSSSTLSGNTSSSAGGGIANYGTATITSSTLSGNVSLRGGGVYNLNAVRITDSTLDGNEANSGGGLHVRYSEVSVITNSTLSGNSADSGGAIYVRNTLASSISNSTLSGNSANLGAGIFVRRSLVSITNSSLSGNSAQSSGGGIHNSDIGSVSITNSIITDTASGGDCVNFATASGANNLSSDDSCPGDIGDVSAFDTTLADNGGPTLTHALLPGSNAIDAGAGMCMDPDGAPLPTDQRGAPRPQDGDSSGSATCDIGAFEYAELFDLDVTLAGTGSGKVMGPAFLGGGIDCGEGGADCDETFANGSSVGLTASAAEGSVFAGWSGDCDAAGELFMTADSACTATFDEAPTAAVLASLEAEVAPIGRVTLRWTTASEAKVLGFHLYRQELLGGRETRVTERLLPARGSAASGADYAYAEHRLPGHYRYRLEALLAGGERQAFAPLRVNVAPGRVGLR